MRRLPPFKMRTGGRTMPLTGLPPKGTAGQACFGRAVATDPRKMNTTGSVMAMLHAIAHIEFNAVNALDAAYRFRTLPFQFAHWVKVAKRRGVPFPA